MELKDFFLVEYARGSIIPDLKKIAETASTASVLFSDGSKTKVTPTSAKIMLAAYLSLNRSSKVKFDNLISKNKRKFDNILNTLYRKLRNKK